MSNQFHTLIYRRNCDEPNGWRGSAFQSGMLRLQSGRGCENSSHKSVVRFSSDAMKDLKLDIGCWIIIVAALCSLAATPALATDYRNPAEVKPLIEQAMQ